MQPFCELFFVSMLALLRPLLQGRSYLLNRSKRISKAYRMSSKIISWQLRFRNQLHFHKNYCMGSREPDR
jgi:hypothetical protein